MCASMSDCVTMVLAARFDPVVSEPLPDAVAFLDADAKGFDVTVTERGLFACHLLAECGFDVEHGPTLVAPRYELLVVDKPMGDMPVTVRVTMMTGSACTVETVFSPLLSDAARRGVRMALTALAGSGADDAR